MNATIDPKHNQAINKIDSHFWREAIKATTLMNKNREPATGSIRTEPIWNNKNIKFKGHPYSTATGVKQELFIYKIFGSVVTS